MYKIKKITQTCSACPSQWDATLTDGRMLYFRYRWGGLSIRISLEPTKNVYDAVGGNEIYCEGLSDDGWDGCLEYEDLKHYTKHLIEYPE